jgi:pilus assembly protein Flp/PilA
LADGTAPDTIAAASQSTAGTDRTTENQMQLIHRLRALARRQRDHEDAQGLAEYALILALIAIIAIVALIFLGGQISGILSHVGNSL